jgi:hypothetical protein
VSVFHAMSNTQAVALLRLGVYESTYLPVVGITTAFAIGIILAYGPQRLIRTTLSSEEVENGSS